MVKYFARIVLTLLMAQPLSAQARDEIRSVGSSTVFPFAAAAAEQFGHAGKFRTPIIESTGTGGGLKMFCEGMGDNFPDMANASRTIKPAELDACREHGVTSITELKLGYDGIVLANGANSKNFALSRKTLFLALAREIPKDGKLVANPYTRWNEIDPALPDVAIELYGRPPSSGTRDAFTDLVMVEGCKQIPAMHALVPDEDTLKKQCAAMREDGHYIEAGDDNNVIVQKLISNPDALGFFSYSYLDSNAALVKANAVDGVMPTYDSIVKGSYPVARGLYVYIKDAQADKVPGLREFTKELASDAASGNDGYLVMKGLLPLSAADHEAMKKVAAQLTPMKF